jgi:L-2-hydroxyglutarate oxidase
MVTDYDIAIIGAGIVGLATARSLTIDHPALRVAVVEKEPAPGRHQSGRNSGVIHSGLYYRPDSLKARLCVSGAARLVDYCRVRGIDHTRNGKLVVATTRDQLGALAELERRGVANGLSGMRRVDAAEMRRIEPHSNGVAALHVPSTGAVDFGEVTGALAADLVERGVEVITSLEVKNIGTDGSGAVLEGEHRSVRVGGFVNCGGLYSDRLAAMAGLDPPVRIIPFRGEYYEVVGAGAGLVRSSIYPVPDPRLPFLGVHLTRGVDGSVQAGPNAVLAGAREGYGWATVRPAELWQSVTYPGLLRLARRHWRSGAGEVIRSASKRRFARSVAELVPDIDPNDLQRGISGVRAQAVARDGTLYDDFLVLPAARSVHVLNAPSPAATSSLAIGDHLARLVTELLDLR